MLSSFVFAIVTSTALVLPHHIVFGDEVTGTKCRHINVSSSQLPTSLTFSWTNVLSTFDTHDTNVAILGICGGIAGSIQKCGGNPAQTTGQSNNSLFTSSATNAGSTINVSKGRWERCVKAAQLTCPKGSFESTCMGGAAPSGDVKFSLTAA
jgi:hypothetical protein